MLKRSEKPEELKIATNVMGEPVGLTRNGRRERVVAIYERWRLDDEWWGKEEKRCYFKIRTSQGFVCDIYHETVAGRWYLYKIYD